MPSSLLRWTPAGRALVFALAATSILSLLVEFYGLVPMQAFACAVQVPATLVLGALALRDRWKGDGRIWRAAVVGSVGGCVAACAYDLFRLPWVLCAAWEAGPAWMRLPLFKVFPHFGTLLLDLPAVTPAAHLLGWAYHFSNGASFGVLYLALVGDAGRRHWLWAVALAAGLELGMLFTPYTGFFGIRPTAVFVTVTLTAHLVFGVVLGLWTRREAVRRVMPGGLSAGCSGAVAGSSG